MPAYHSPRLLTAADVFNRTTTIARDPQGNPLVMTRPNGTVTTMTYDAKGNLLTSTEQSIAATTAFTYEPVFNQVTRITDPKGNQTNITYDIKGNPLTITDADNKVTAFTYNTQGRLITARASLRQCEHLGYHAGQSGEVVARVSRVRMFLENSSDCDTRLW